MYLWRDLDPVSLPHNLVSNLIIEIGCSSTMADSKIEESSSPTESVTVNEIKAEADFSALKSSFPPSALLVVYFHAPWAAPCQHMSTVLKTLASTYHAQSPPIIAFLSVDAEEVSEVAEAYDVTAVPYIVLQKDGKTIETISGSDASKVRDAVERHAKPSGDSSKFTLPPEQNVTRPEQPSDAEGDAQPNGHATSNGLVDSSGSEDPTQNAATSSKEELHKRLSELVKAAPVMLFMKGTPSAPQCGFSRQTVSILREKGIRYGFFNILADDEVRQGLKEFADWPTFPQLWAGGELVGGLDIVSTICYRLDSSVRPSGEFRLTGSNRSKKSSRMILIFFRSIPLEISQLLLCPASCVNLWKHSKVSDWDNEAPVGCHASIQLVERLLNLARYVNSNGDHQ